MVINLITRHFYFQVSDVALEADFSQRMTAFDFKALDSSSRCGQLAQGDAEKVEQPPRDNT